MQLLFRSWIHSLTMLIIPLLWISCHKAETRLESYYADLAVGFEHLPDSTKPWVYWYWISDHISKDGISRDLELMDSLGIGTALIGNVYLGNIVRGKIPVLSDNWYEHLQFAISEGARLGVDIGVFNGPGWVQSGGPWIDSTKCMHYLICKDTMVDTGFQLNRSSLGSMQGQPVALFAYPGKSILDQPVPNSVQGSFLDKSVKNLFDGRTDTKYAFPKGEMENRDLVIDFSYSNSISARSIKLIPGAEPFYVAFDLEVWKGNKFVNVCSGSIDRSNQMLTVGPRVFAPVIKAFAEVSGKKWRIRFRDLNKNKVWFTDVKRNGSLKEVILSGDEKLEGYVEKQLGKMHQLPGPDWKAYQWSEQVDYVDSTSHVNPETFLDLSGLLNDDAKTWTAPPGNWHIYQLSMVPTGVTNAPVAPEAQGFDVDKMQRRYVFDHFDHYIDPLLNRLSTQEKPALKYLVIDSYETGSQNWTDGLQGRFLEIYGYDPLPWLPVINGDIVGSPDLSDRFLWDLRRLIADEISNQYVSGLREKAQENGMKLWVENYGHWGFPGEFLQYGGQADLVGGEFWLDDPLGEIECRAAASAGHINGKSPIFAEAFTAPRKHYARYPGLLRQRGDWSYIQGINHHVLHVYIHQPYQDTMPGINTWFGVEFNRQNIWFPKSKSWIDYLRRNHFLLQQGNYVADVCYFIGEGAPVMTGITEPGLPEGYAFDFINADVIINDMYVKDHRLYLSNGMSYALMVLPPLKTMRPELLEKLEQLVQQGAYIYGAAPTRSPSLEHYPLADRAVQNLATNVWGMENGQKKRAFGNGLVFNNLELTDVLKEIQVEPDLLIEGTLADSILWMHRKKEDIDIYFLTNQSMKSVNVNAEFRVQKRNPEIWDAVSGEIRPLFQFANRNERIQIPLRFLPGESYYVVFSDKTSPLREVGNFTEYTEVLNLNTGWKIAFDTTRKGPMKILESQELFDWSESENDSIKYFSGSAEYRKTFEFEGDTIANYFLDVGKLCWVANVSLNGTPMGGIWTDPARIRLNGLKRGLNLLEIEVTNTWVNRLIGDSQLPEKERMTWTAENPYRPGSPLQHAGLLGPVRLLRSSD